MTTPMRDPLLENEMLRGIVKVLCADLSPYGSAAFIRARDHALNEPHRALLLEVLDGSPIRKFVADDGVLAETRPIGMEEPPDTSWVVMQDIKRVGAAEGFVDHPPPQHVCAPPINHGPGICGCDGTGGRTITEADVAASWGFPAEFIGSRTACIDGQPAAVKGARWLCRCGTGWIVGDACDLCWTLRNPADHDGLHSFGVRWRRLGRFASWRLRRAARRREDTRRRFA